GQQPDQLARFQIVMDQKSRAEKDPNTRECRSPQRLTAVGDEIARDSHRRGRSLAIDETPLVATGITDMADTVAVGDIDELLRLAVPCNVGMRAAQHMPPGGEAPHDQADRKSTRLNSSH